MRKMSIHEEELLEERLFGAYLYAHLDSKF